MIRVGIIGLGVGEAHILGYEAHPLCKVTALCDFDEAKLQATAVRHGIDSITTVAEDILDNPEIDVVSIASNDNFHYEQVIRAIQNKKHVFVEKPLCQYEWQAKEIRRELEKNQVHMSSNLILRKYPRFAEIHERINRGFLGDVYLIEADYNYGRLEKILTGWRGQIDGYSITLGGGVHLVDLLMWFLKERVVEVTSYSSKIASQNTTFRYVDTVISLLRFESGRLGKICSNFPCVYPHFHKLTVYGTKATAENSLAGLQYHTDRSSANAAEESRADYPGARKSDLIANFINAIGGHAEGAVTTDEIFDTLSVCFAIDMSARESKPIKVQYL